MAWLRTHNYMSLSKGSDEPILHALRLHRLKNVILSSDGL